MNPDIKRHIISKDLIHQSQPARYGVDAENRRIKKLLNEHYTNPYAREPRWVGFGRRLLTKAGLHSPKPSKLVERPGLEASQQRQNEFIATELDSTRELIRNNILEGIDDVAVDTHLGLRTDECTLPPFFQELHKEAEAEAGSELSFLKWMADYATNEQLMNVWQWHDSYLNERDNNPSFQERIAALKARYAHGSMQAIEAGTLHPDIAIQNSRLDDLKIVHGSPFSPHMAVAEAYVDKKLNVVQMREDVSDFTLYHEMTHSMTGGMQLEFDEGTTDLIAAEIYNRSTQEQVDPRITSVYADQIATLDAINHMTGGKTDLHELSRIYAGPDNLQNTFLFISQIDKELDLPIAFSMIKLSRDFLEEAMATHNGSVVRQAQQMIMRRQVEILAAMMFDDEGNKIAGTAKELLTRMFSKETINKYSTDAIVDGATVIKQAQNIQEQYHHS